MFCVKLVSLICVNEIQSFNLFTLQALVCPPQVLVLLSSSFLLLVRTPLHFSDHYISGRVLGFVVIFCVIVIICGINVILKRRNSIQSHEREPEANTLNVIAMVESPGYGSSLPQDDPRYESISGYLSPE